MKMGSVMKYEYMKNTKCKHSG